MQATYTGVHPERSRRNTAGLRKRKSVGATLTHYAFSGSKVIAEYTGNYTVTSPTKEYIYAGSQLVATLSGSTPTYVHPDHLSTRLQTSSTGAVTRTFGHYSFGETWYESSTDKWKFTSYERDSESGLDYAIFRYDNSRLGRFQSPDPWAGSTRNPQSLNRYSYVWNDPVNLLDPLGLCPAECQSCTYLGYGREICWNGMSGRVIGFTHFSEEFAWDIPGFGLELLRIACLPLTDDLARLAEGLEVVARRTGKAASAGIGGAAAGGLGPEGLPVAGGGQGSLFLGLEVDPNGKVSYVISVGYGFAGVSKNVPGPSEKGTFKGGGAILGIQAGINAPGAQPTLSGSMGPPTLGPGLGGDVDLATGSINAVAGASIGSRIGLGALRNRELLRIRACPGWVIGVQ